MVCLVLHNTCNNKKAVRAVDCCFVKSVDSGTILFNDALNTFYLRLYSVGHMVKDHSDSERGNPLPPHGLLFLINSKVFFVYAPSHRQDSTYYGLCYTSRGSLAGTIYSLIVHREGSIRRPIAPRANALTAELHLAPPHNKGSPTPNHVTARSGRKEMFYLTTHSTHLFYGYMTSKCQVRVRGAL